MSKPTGQRAPTDGGVKTLVRNCRSAPSVPVKGSRHDDRDKKEATATHSSAPSDRTPTNDLNLEEPQLHTSLKIKENLQKMKAGMKSVRFEPKVSADVRSKASKKVNIRFDEKIYKDLIDLKVSEDDLGLRTISSGKSVETSSAKDPVPVLADFFKPSFNKEYIVKPYPVTFKVKKAEYSVQTSSVLEAVKRWSVDDNKD